MAEPGQFVDVCQVRRNFARAAASYDASAVLAQEINRRMLERLDYVKIAPQRVLDLGCVTGGSLTALGERYRGAAVVGADASEHMLQRAQGGHSRLRRLMPFLRGPRAPLLAADARSLPFRSNSFGFLWSNLMLHWMPDPLAALREMHRVIDPGGLLMFSTVGPDTLRELRASFGDDDEHVQSFTDMHDLGDMLVECGFSDPVMDTERLTLTYATVDDFFRDLRHTGATCALPLRRRGLMGRGAFAAVRERYESWRLEGRLPATIEVIYGHAWKVPPRTTEDGRAIIRFDRPSRFRPDA